MALAPRRPLVGRAVEVDERHVHAALVDGVEPVEHLGDLAVHVLHRPEHALAPVAVAAVAPFRRLVDARRRPRGDDGPPPGAGVQDDLHLDGGVAAGVEDLPRRDLFDGAHSSLVPLL